MPRHRDVNPIDVIEAAYDLEVDDTTWLDHLARTIRPLLDHGRGFFAYRYDARTSSKEWHASTLYYDLPPARMAKVQALRAKNPDLIAVAHFNYEGLLGLRELARKAGFGDVAERPSVARMLELLDAQDMAALQTVEPGGQGVVFSAGQREERHWTPRQLRLWARVNAHIAAGRRLREAIANDAANRGVTADAREEAILDPTGKVQHAQGEGESRSARVVLREAVQRVEKARGKQRTTDPEGATEAWTAMVSGRWSLVDRFERDGRRYIVARRNEHGLPDPRALTRRERAIAHLAALGKPNKLIGYELGLSDSTVGSHLSQAMRKLGARSRVDLVHLLAIAGNPKK